jgi:hypothetical protein
MPSEEDLITIIPNKGIDNESTVRNYLIISKKKNFFYQNLVGSE